MQSKRSDIIAATKTLLWDVGYEAMSPKRILRESGAGQGSLYHHFDGKKHVAAVALGEMEAEMSARIEAAFSPDRPPIERIRGFLLKERDGLKGCRLGRLANETAITEPELRQPVSVYFKIIEEKVEQALREATDLGEISPAIDQRAAAVSIVAVVQGGFALSRIHQDPGYITHATLGADALLTQILNQPKNH